MRFITKKITFHISKFLSFGILAAVSFLIALLFRSDGDNNSDKNSYILLSGDQLLNFTSIAHADVPPIIGATNTTGTTDVIVIDPGDGDADCDSDADADC